MNKFIDMTGQKIEHWTVIERAENYKNGTAQWLCRCECGNTSIIFGSKLRSGKAKGCIHCAQKTHGFGGTRIFNIYCSMKNRCLKERKLDDWIKPFVDSVNERFKQCGKQ